MPGLFQKYEHALQLILKSMQKSAAHVFVFGSFARGELTPHSDLDILVVRKVGKPGHEIRTMRGVTVEIVFTTREQLIRALRTEMKSHSRRTSSMLATSKLVYGDASLQLLIALAKRVYKKQVPALSAREKSEYKEYLQQLPRICKEYQQRGDALNLRLRLDAALQDLVSRYFHITRQPIPQHKLMSTKITDAVFKKQLLRALQATRVSEKIAAIERMTRRLLTLF